MNPESASCRSTEKVKLNIKPGCVSLTIVSSIKYLGVVIDENVAWKKKNTFMQLEKKIGMLTKLKHFVPENK